MKKSIIISLIFWPFLTTSAQSERQKSSDREVQTLEKLYYLQKEEAEENTKANEKIYSFYYETINEIRKNQNKITSSEYESLYTYQKNLWDQVIKRSELYTSKTKFLSNEIQNLYNYRENVLNKLSEYVYNHNESKKTTIDYKSELSNSKIKLDNCLTDYNDLLLQSGFLKKNNYDLISALENMTQTMNERSENFSKISKQKDTVILELKQEIIKKDGLILNYINELDKLKK